MYTWYIKIYLKSGQIVKGSVDGDYSNSGKLANSLFQGNANSFVGIKGINQSNLCFILGEVAAFDISSKPFED